MKCLSSPRIKHGSFLKNELNFGEKLQVICDPGYTLEKGEDDIQCSENGHWSKESVNCVPVTCENINELNNGYVDYKHKEDVLKSGHPVATVAEFSCRPGYQIRGAKNVTCLIDGNWSNPIPNCQRK